jgi:hypothetical protein
MAKENYKVRFGDAPWASNIQKIVLGGVGGIGSWLALSLARVGHELYIYDMDTIEDTNIAGQFFRTGSIGSSKTAETAENLKNFCDNAPNTFGEFTDKSFVTPITIAAFDNMEARIIMYNKWKAQEDRELFLDGRMTAEYFEVFAVQKGMEEAYEKALFPSSEANKLPCSFKATTHNAMGIAYVMTSVLNNFLSNDESGLREVPFFTKMNAALMWFQPDADYDVE